MAKMSLTSLVISANADHMVGYLRQLSHTEEVQKMFWKDIDKDVLKKSLILSGSFFKRNCIYVYCFSIFIFIHGFIEEIDPSGIYIKLLGILTFLCLVLFTYDWYTMLNTSVLKKSIPQELIDIRSVHKRI